MSQMRFKLLSRAALAACVVGLIALKFAWATPQSGIVTTILTGGPLLMDEIDVHSGDDDHQVKIKTKGLSDVYVVRNVIAPGGHTGWHSHLGPSIISVVSGKATAYEEGDSEGTVIPAGLAFVDSGEHAHIIRNEGDTNLELIAFQILPVGAPRRIDETAP